MAVVMRLKRMGRRNRPFYRICVMDVRTRRDGRAIEELGHYDPINPDKGRHFELNEERAQFWITEGARPSETVASFLKERGIEIPVNRRKRLRTTKKAKS
jgi:small subunit ribosomal protein S16